MSHYHTLAMYEQIYQSLGFPLEPYSYYCIAGWIAAHGRVFEYSMEDMNGLPFYPQALYDSQKCYEVAERVKEKNGFHPISGMALDVNGFLVPHCFNVNGFGRVIDCTWWVESFAQKERFYIGVPVDKGKLPFRILYEPLTALLKTFQFNYILLAMLNEVPVKRFWYRSNQFYKPEDEHVWQHYLIPCGAV
jgi:hypothetical protein